MGVAALFLAGLLLLMEWRCDPGRGGFEFCFDSFFYTVSAILGVLGALGIAFGRHMIREARELREFNKAMELGNRSKED